MLAPPPVRSLGRVDARLDGAVLVDVADRCVEKGAQIGALRSVVAALLLALEAERAEGDETIRRVARVALDPKRSACCGERVEQQLREALGFSCHEGAPASDATEAA